jgi:hypothetical protein
MPALPDGRPRTFLAVTNDFEAVEVDTLTGDVIRRIGQAGTRAELEAAEAAAAVNVIDGVWRTIDGSRLVVSECCEPAAGALHVLEASDQFTPEGQTITGWGVGPSPVTAEFAVVGYSIEVGTPEQWRFSAFLDPAISGFPSGSPAWSRDGESVYWWAERPQGAETEWELVTLDLTTGELATTIPTWVPEDSRPTGIAAAGSGVLVSILTTDAFTVTEGAVMSATGELIERFPIEDGSVLGGYDPSGRFLIYVDGDGTARWLAGAESGTLGEGYVFASW